MKFTVKSKVFMVILAVLMAAGLILFFYAKSIYGGTLEVDYDMVTASTGYDVKIVKQDNEATDLAKESGENFKLLAFTDMHFDGMDEEAMDQTMEEFVKAMNEERPDLVVFTGDIITAIFNKERAEILADVMEAYGIYWCAILGNHEGEHPLSYSREALIKLWSNHEAYPHCLVNSGPKELYGYGNYMVNLLDTEHSISQSLIFLDSGDYVKEEDVKSLHVSEGSYDYIKADQINWYREKINTLPKGTKSSLFIHIPLCEYATGWDEIYEEANGTITNTKDCSWIYGMLREPVCCAEYNSGLFEVMVSLGSTQNVYCGHDHINDFSILYQGIKLNYLQASGYSTYGWNEAAGTKTNILEEQFLQGYTILEINASGETVITRKRYKE